MTDYLRPWGDLEDPRIGNLFDEVTFWCSRFGRLLFDNLELRSGIDILDVGCASGFPTFELAQTHGRSCQVTGIDIWRPALARARAKLELFGLQNVTLIEADAARMPFADGSFDLITSNLGLNNFADPKAVAAECFRVSRPGARLVLTTNARGHFREFYALFRGLLEAWGRADWIERLAADEAHRSTRESLAGLLGGAGLEVTRVVEDRFTMRFVDGTAFLGHWLTRIGFLDAWRRVVDPALEVDVFQALEQRLNAEAAKAGELRMTVPMLYVEATRP